MKQQAISNQSNRTTDEMIEAISKDIAKSAGFISLNSIIDVGAGDGSTLKSKYFDDNDTYVKLRRKSGIEKSVEHVSSWNNTINFVGGDFFENSLHDIDAEVLFCHPPHSNYEAWAVKVINESYAVVNYLVLPEQWQASEAITRALADRSYSATIILAKNSSDEDSGKVDVIRVIKSLRLDRDEMMKSVPLNSRYEEDLIEKGTYIFTCNHIKENDPVDDQFITLLPNLATVEEKTFFTSDNQSDSADSIFKNSADLADMVGLYNKDKAKVIASYKALNDIDLGLFKELDIDIDTLKEKYKQSLCAVRRLYWNAFIKSYDPVTSRLTSDYADLITKEALSKTTIEFTASNALIVTNIIIKRASAYSDQQADHLFQELSNDVNAKPYRSNTDKPSFERNRYFRDRKLQPNYSLGFQTIKDSMFNVSANYSNDLICGISANKVIDNISIIAKLIGMHGVVESTIADNNRVNRGIPYGQLITANLKKDGKSADLLTIKFYKNGNQHLSLAKEFILRLNIYICKLHGWIEDASEAFIEMQLDGVSEEEFNTIWDDTKINSINESNAGILIGD